MKENDKSSKSKEHEAVFGWCVESVTLMLNVMPLQHQKNFLRKVSDEVEGTKIFNDLKQQHQKEWAVLRDTSEQISKLQDGIDTILDKVRTKVLGKTVEADQLLEKYRLMLELGEGKLKEARQEIPLSELVLDDNGDLKK